MTHQLIRPWHLSPLLVNKFLLGAMSSPRKKNQRTQALPSVSSHATYERYKTHSGIWCGCGVGAITNPELSHPALPIITQAHLPIFMPCQLFCGLMSRAFCNVRGSKGWDSVRLHCACWSRHSTDPRLHLSVALSDSCLGVITSTPMGWVQSGLGFSAHFPFFPFPCASCLISER